MTESSKTSVHVSAGSGFSSEKSNDEKSVEDDMSLVSEKDVNEDEMKREKTPPPMPLVLEPDHPMMQRFQTALKNHLTKQIEKLSSQISEMDHDFKRMEKEKEEIGLELYGAQQEVYRQQKVLEECEVQMETLTKERESLDESLNTKKLSWKEEVNQLNCAKKKEMDMVAELKKLSTIEKQMEKWEKEIESDLTVSQRISEKTAYDKNKLIEEKRKMDMYLLKLMMSVSNFEAELKLLDGEIDLKMEEKESLSQTVADAGADLQALITEQKRLVSAWNSVASMINQKNTAYAVLAADLKKCQDSFQSLNSEIEGYKRSSAEEMKKSEKLAIIYGRLETDLDSCENLLKSLMGKKSIVQEKITALTAMIARTEAELLHAKVQKDQIQGDLISVKNNYQKLCEEHRKMEDDAMACLHEKITNDKSAVHLNKLLKETRERNRAREFNLLETENKISQKFLEAEELKESITQSGEVLKETNKELTAKEEELKKIQEEIDKCCSAILQKQGNYATLTRKIEKYIEMTNFGKNWLTPSQQRISDLEKTNAEIQAKNEKMQTFWLIQQNNNVLLTRKRSDQLKEINLLRKQVLLYEQRTLKTDREFEKEKAIENEVNKSIAQLQHKLVGLNELLVGKKDYKENLGKETALTQAQFVQNLKDSELEQIRLKGEIKDLESNLEELADAMLATQREMLAWERKIQSAIEAKNDMQKQKSSSGDIGQMKAEIHRMEVRYGQLKRVQEKLITDLEQCVFRRDAIMDGAEAVEKRQGRVNNTRFAIQKKLDTLKGNIRSTKNDRKQIKKAIANTQEGHEDLRKTIMEKQNSIMEMNETTRRMDEQLEESRLQKCKNLEMLIKRQKKCKLYEMVKKGKHRLLFKSESVLDNEIQKVKCRNQDLISIMEALIQDFPSYRFYLKKIRNTFEAKPS